MRGSYVHYYIICLLSISLLLAVNVLAPLARWLGDNGLWPATLFLCTLGALLAAWRRQHR